MKKIIVLLLCAFSFTAAFSQVVVKGDGAMHPNGAYPVALTDEIKGAPKWATDIAGRNAIAPNMRSIGMLCYVVADRTFYYLDGAIDDGSWKKLSVDLSAYLTITDAANTYATQTYVNGSLATKLSTTEAATTYAAIATLNSYLLSTTAATTYATKTALNSYLLSTDAANTYATQTYVNGSLATKLSTTEAATTYAAIATLNSYLLSTTAATTYATKTALNSYLLSTDAANTYATQTYVNGALAAKLSTANNLSDLQSIPTARFNLGLGSLSLMGHAMSTGYLPFYTGTMLGTSGMQWNGTTMTLSSVGDMEVNDPTKGIILRTSDGTRARITLIKTNGVLTLQISDPL